MFFDLAARIGETPTSGPAPTYSSADPDQDQFGPNAKTIQSSELNLAR